MWVEAMRSGAPGVFRYRLTRPAFRLAGGRPLWRALELRNLSRRLRGWRGRLLRAPAKANGRQPLHQRHTALFGVLVWLEGRRHRDGDVIVAYTVLYAIARFILEFFRGDADRGFLFGGLLSTSQFIGALMCIVAVIVLFVRKPAKTRT